jgi:hypothetical protein
MWEWEFEFGLHELLDVRSTDVRRLLDLHDANDLRTLKVVTTAQKEKKQSTYMDRSKTGTMPGSHILIHALDGVRSAQLPKLLVHVMRSRARVVPKPDAKVLCLQWLLFVDLSSDRDHMLWSVADLESRWVWRRTHDVNS